MSEVVPAVRPAGDRALLVPVPRPADPAALARALHEASPPGVDEVLPAAATVLVTLGAGADRAAVVRAVEAAVRAAPTEAPGPPGACDGDALVVPVRYDGSDLDEVARHLGLTTTEVVERHTAGPWRCRFVGFTAGFGYLEPVQGGLRVPRRAEPRTAVPAGAVALADGYGAVYPRACPGGWQLIGRTDLRVWDAGRARPGLVEPGTLVRFEAVGPWARR